MKIAERETPETELCPSCSVENSVKRYYGETHLAWSDPIQLGLKKTPSDWRDFIKHLKKNTKGSADNINCDN